jgi:hypothetical protein
MTLHFHLGRLPVTLSVRKGESVEHELDELREALLWYALRFPAEGQRARFTLRRWAGGSPR